MTAALRPDEDQSCPAGRRCLAMSCSLDQAIHCLRVILQELPPTLEGTAG